MLFHVTMDVDLPPDLDPATKAETLSREKAYCQRLQDQGKWVHIWRVVGQYANVSIFDVDSPGELHEILWNLPLFPFMTVTVTPLCRHPSAL
ncbi:muconolactone delta-isomerase [Kribbella sp. ALI-6-A]|uniref:muconolactone Delta-isomerase n=1 Tax=Kribbella sp. ALI-6-A TaxID=1933817 RepID=UPI00097CB7F1|nr:muconolactone Delta-isomerase [Kribbella sp. ALI-6-A]ONI74068.1 muconolactone delta-isomerase [Kribbella sp. ALI-6-A]